VNMRTKIGVGVAGGVAALALGIGGAAWAMAGDEDALASGAAVGQARAAALAAVPDGRASEVEAESDEGNAYGGIVTKPDGTQIELHLDRNCQVLDTEPADRTPTTEVAMATPTESPSGPVGPRCPSGDSPLFDHLNRPEPLR
jgi:hypothetical protein